MNYIKILCIFLFAIASLGYSYGAVDGPYNIAGRFCWMKSTLSVSSIYYKFALENAARDMMNSLQEYQWGDLTKEAVVNGKKVVLRLNIASGTFVTNQVIREAINRVVSNAGATYIFKHAYVTFADKHANTGNADAQFGGSLEFSVYANDGHTEFRRTTEMQSGTSYTGDCQNAAHRAYEWDR